MKISVHAEDFDLGVEVKKLYGSTAIGAVASFIGVVRDVPMTLEHYPGMTEKALRKIAEEASTRWKVLDCTVIHRYGSLQPGAPSPPPTQPTPAPPRPDEGLLGGMCLRIFDCD